MSHGQDTAAEAQRVASNNWVRDAVPARMWISSEHGAEMAAKIEAMTVAARPGQFLMPPRETWPAIDAMAKDFRAIVDERDAGRNKVARLQAQLDACGETIAKLQTENGELRNELGASASAAETTWLRDQIKRPKGENAGMLKAKADYWRNEAEKANAKICGAQNAKILGQSSLDEWQRVLADANRRAQEAAAQRDDIQTALSDLRESHRANLAIIAKLRDGLSARPSAQPTGDAQAIAGELRAIFPILNAGPITRHQRALIHRAADLLDNSGRLKPPFPGKDPARAMDRAITATIAGWRPTI